MKVGTPHKRSLGLLTVLILLAGSSAPTPADEGGAQKVRLLFYSGDLCRSMPPSLNPFGENCHAEVNKRFPACYQTHRTASPAFDECLGFKAPPPIPARFKLQEYALRKQTAEMCDTAPVDFKPRGDCKGEVEKRFVRCGGAFLNTEIDAQALYRCLGFEIPPPAPEPKVLVECSPPRIRAKMAVFVAHSSPWQGSRRQTFKVDDLFLAPRPEFTERDLQSVRLEDRAGELTLWAFFSPRARSRFAEVTAANVGEWIVISFGGQEQPFKVQSSVTQGKLILSRGEQLLPADVCRAQ